MDILRWILIVAGIAILALLYFQGRPGMRRSSAVGRAATLERSRDHDIGMNNMGRSRPGDPLLNDPFSETARDPLENFDHFDDVYDERAEPRFDAGADRWTELDPPAHDTAYDPPRDPSQGETELGVVAPRGRRGLASRIEAISARLSPGRTERLRRARDGKDGHGIVFDGPGSHPAGSGDSKIVTLHVVAPEGQIIDGMSLAQAFEARGYEYGDMDIFHSYYDGKTLFSIVKGVEPGTFDCSDVASFDTPGVSLVLQLPGPVPADVAFEVLVTEARELADMLGCSVLDAERSTLSRQSVQHMRESINDYMHRQKYFQGVPS